MSLIVDINPVPWEILDLVKARILRNRLRKKRERDDGKTRRADSLRPGPLSTRRWEQPSFVYKNKIPFITIQTRGDLKQLREPPFPDVSKVGNKIQIKLKFNGNTIQDFIHADLFSYESFCYVWSNGIDGIEEILGPGTASRPVVDIGQTDPQLPHEPYTWKIIPLQIDEPEFFDKTGFVYENYQNLYLQIVEDIHNESSAMCYQPPMPGGPTFPPTPGYYYLCYFNETEPPSFNFDLGNLFSKVEWGFIDIVITWGYIENQIVTISGKQSSSIGVNGPIKLPPFIFKIGNGPNTEIISSVDYGNGFHIYAKPATVPPIYSIDPVNRSANLKIAFYND